MNVLVVGGGLAGLSVATLLTRFGVQVTTLSPEFGGVLSNINVANPFGEGIFKFDFRLNKHVKEGAFHQLVRGVEGVTVNQRKEFYLEMPYIDTTTWVNYPVEDNTKQLVFELPVEEGQYESDQDLESYALHKFGEEFYKEWFEPFFQRKFSTYPDHLDSDWTGEINDTSPEFVYVPGQAVVQTMLASLLDVDTGGWIWVNGMLRSLWRSKDGWYAVGSSGSSVLNIGPFDAVVSSIGIQELVSSLERFENIPVPPTVWNNIISCGVMMKGKFKGDFSWLYPDVALRAHRVALQSRLSPGLAPEGHDSLLIEFPTFDNLSQNVIESLSLDVETLLKLLDVRTNRVCWVANKGYPIPTLGIRSQIADVKRQLARHNVYSIGRWGSHALMESEHIMGESLRCVNLLMSGEEEAEYLWPTDRYKVYEEMKYDN